MASMTAVPPKIPLACAALPSDAGKAPAVTDRRSGLQLEAVGGFGQVRLLLPGQPWSEQGIEVYFPADFTVQRAGAALE